MPQRRQTQNTHQQTPDPQLLQISRELDIEYLELRDHIAASSYFGTASKHLRIRLDNWLSKLDTIIANITWKRNRNNYAKLIDLMCECETVVEPFTALPPQGDVPKMNRHQINRIIDEVERQVKLEKMQSRGSEEVNMVRSSRVKPNQFWSRVKSQREFGTKGSFLSDQSSMFMGKSEQNGDFRDGNKKVDLSFNHISQSSKQSDKKKYQFSSEDAISNSSKDKQNLIEPNKFYITNNSHEQIHQNRPKPFQKAPKHLSVKLNTQLHKVQLIRSPLFEASVPQQKVKYTESLNTDNFSDKNSRLQAFRDQHISFDYENQTLKTQYLDQDISLNPQRIQDLSFFSADQCDFSDQLSERCRYKQGVLSQQYFGWRKNQRELLQDYKANLERAGPKESQLAHVPRKLMVKASAFKIVPTNHLNPQFQNSYQQQFLDEPDEIFNGTNSFSIISDHQFQEQVFPNKTNERQIDNVNSIA